MRSLKIANRSIRFGPQLTATGGDAKLILACVRRDICGPNEITGNDVDCLTSKNELFSVSTLLTGLRQARHHTASQDVSSCFTVDEPFARLSA